MPLDPSKISIRPRRRAVETDPEKIFESLTLRGTVENLWSPQAEALRDWHTERDKSDITVAMNTGGGKTIVGLLIAQSLVNETRGLVLYVCPTNQLVEQAASKAAECSLSVATYMRGSWIHRDVADESRGACITNYAAVFNGKSIFAGEDVAALVLDDAHVAGNTIRSQFTVRLPSGSPGYAEVAKLFRGCFVSNDREQSFCDTIEGDPRSVLFVPMFEVRRAAPQLRKFLVEQGVADDTATLFAWEHIKDRIDRCSITISGSGVEIAPTNLPLHTLNCLKSHVRRVYLTATLPSATTFIRTFGGRGGITILPGGKSGEAQRLFVFSLGESEQDQRQEAERLIERRKACIIVPSTRAASKWEDCGQVFGRTSGQADIDAFAQSTSPEKLILVARYDGIDLPGKACRILVIDGLPQGSSLIDRFLDESLQIESHRSAQMAVRLIQAIGRIFRSNTDHGAVVLCGTDIQRWLRSPRHQEFLPPLLQRQIQLGMELRDNVDDQSLAYGELLDAVLDGDNTWDQLYEEHVDRFDTSAIAPLSDWMVEIAAREQAAHERLWEGDYAAAAREFAQIAGDSVVHDERLAAWFHHWEGFAADCVGDRMEAYAAYTRAANIRSELGRPKTDPRNVFTTGDVDKASEQAQAIAAVLLEKPRGQIFTQLDQIDGALVFGSDTKPTEQAICGLGTLLGLHATRPDNAEKTGPDVLWRHVASKSGVAIEAKTNKKTSGMYRKKDIGQFYDHMGYLDREHPDEEFQKIIVGPRLRVTSDSNPPDDLRIIQIEVFRGLAKRLRQLFELAFAARPGDDPSLTIERWMRHLGLAWPLCIEALASTLAIDLQGDPDARPDSE